MALLKSRRAQRMERHHKRHSKNAGLSLVSLMDIFTILVFFLLVNASEVEVLPAPKSMTLPLSVSAQRPDETPVLMLQKNQILLNGETIISTQQLNNGDWLEALTSALAAVLVSSGTNELTPPDDASENSNSTANPGPRITIMGDKGVPFTRVRQVMQASGKAGFARVSLAVEKDPNAMESDA